MIHGLHYDFSVAHSRFPSTHYEIPPRWGKIHEEPSRRTLPRRGKMSYLQNLGDPRVYVLKDNIFHVSTIERNKPKKRTMNRIHMLNRKDRQNWIPTHKGLLGQRSGMKKEVHQ